MHQLIGLRWRSNSHLSLSMSISLGLGFLVGITTPTWALPGQTVDEAVTWIQRHPTLQPSDGERLRVRKSDTPAHRFMFEALLYSPGGTDSDDRNLIRMEQLSFFDRTTGVSPSRLQHALQVIYGPDVYQDYQQASVVYQYPDLVETEPESDAPLRELLQGEVRQGERYGYWLETVPTAEGIAYNGQISVFLVEDVEGVVSALQRR